LPKRFAWWYNEKCGFFRDAFYEREASKAFKNAKINKLKAVGL